MRTHAQILSTRETAQIAELCGVSVYTVRSWKHRDRIPDAYWRSLVNAEVATLAELADAADQRRARKS